MCVRSGLGVGLVVPRDSWYGTSTAHPKQSKKQDRRLRMLGLSALLRLGKQWLDDPPWMADRQSALVPSSLGPNQAHLPCISDAPWLKPVRRN